MGFYRGLSICTLGCIPAHGLFFFTYEFSKVKFNISNSNHHPYLFALTGSIASLCHDFIMTPCDAIK